MSDRPLIPNGMEDPQPSWRKRRKGGRPKSSIQPEANEFDDEIENDIGIPPTPPPDVTEEESVSGELIKKAREVLAELANRSTESLSMYQALPLVERFHTSKTQIRLLRGSNRSGKTLGAAVEVARAVTGQDPFNKWPTKDGRMFCIGKDGKHLGDVMYRKLFRPRAMLMIRDKLTGRWRSWLPYLPEDIERINETKPAPPLVPRRFVRDVAWENKKANIPSIVKLHNGWELNFFSSLAKPPQGSDIDGAWLDEEIVDPDWIPEMQARLLDRNGKMIWSCTPQAGTEHLFDLHERAEDEADDPDKQVEEFVALLADNAYMTDKAKRDFERNITSEDERLVRIGGEFAVSGFRVYPEYGDRHLCDYFDVPGEWTRYAYIDPGRQRCAVLFIAIPPPGVEQHAYAYDELYIKDCDARKFGRKMAEKCKGVQFYDFYIDFQEARKRETGSGKTIREQYAAALAANGVESVCSGNDFSIASKDVASGIEAFRSWIVEDEAGLVKLRVLRGKCPNLDRELRRYHYQRIGGIITDKPVKRNDHLADAARYAAASDPQYHKPKRRSKTLKGILDYLAKKRARRRKGKGGSGVNLGPGSNDQR